MNTRTPRSERPAEPMRTEQSAHEQNQTDDGLATHVASPGINPGDDEEAPEGQVKIRCIVHNVHLGDGRQLVKGDTAFVDEELAKFLDDRDQIKRV